ncbi:MAG: hypothetical protein RLZZ44_801 [Bacteroidota bacterium]|jgi:hypothetical protein
MKQLLVFIAIIGLAWKGQAQSEFSAKFKAIPIGKFPIAPKKAAEPKKVAPPNSDIPSIKAPNVFNSPNAQFTKPTPVKSYQLGQTNTFSMIPKNEFIKPGGEVEARLNKKDEEPGAIVYRRNQNLGDFRTKAEKARVMYRDAASVDGDEIRVYLNDKVIESQVTLEGAFKGFEISLDKGFNKIDFEALNQGTSGPNTAEFRVYDDKGVLINASQWNLGTGFKATILLIKE